MTRLRLTLAALLAVSVAVTVAGPAIAKPDTAKAIWGPLELDGKRTMPTYARLGAGIYQTQLRWEKVAPTRPDDPTDPDDPAYEWPAILDEAIRQADRSGIQVLLLVQGTPRWANGGRAWEYPAKSPRAYADFITAAARRYPAVRRWMIWGEPNGYGVTDDGTAISHFMGIEPDRGRPLPRSKQGGVQLYARYLDAAYGRLKAESRRNVVIGGNTWTAGAVRPIHWIKALRLPNGRPPRMDLYGHNPYTNRKPDLRNRPLARGTADFSDLDTLGRAIDRNLGRTASGKKIGIFLSELTLPTYHGVEGLPLHVTRRQQASWIAAGMRIVRRSKRVKTLGIFRFNDEAHGAGVTRHAHWGLIDHHGKPKPAYFAFANG